MRTKESTKKERGGEKKHKKGKKGVKVIRSYWYSLICAGAVGEGVNDRRRAVQGREKVCEAASARVYGT